MVKTENSQDSLASESRAVFLTAFVAALLGWVIGAFLFPSWQHSVETGQVLAGLVPYPNNDNPLFVYHTGTTNLINSVSAFFITYYDELVATVVVSGLQGMVSYGAIALIALPFLPRWYWAAFIPPVLHAAGILHVAAAYRIEFAGSPSTFGVIGLGFYLFNLGLLVNNRVRTAGVISGFFPIIHPTLGLIFVFHVAGYFLFRIVLRRPAKLEEGFRFGVVFLPMFAICSWFFLERSGTVSTVPVSPDDLGTTFEFIRDWSAHHRDFPFVSPAGFSFLILAFALSVYRVLAAKGRLILTANQTRALDAAVTASWIGLAFALASHLPTDLMPLLFWQLMPPRIPNILMVTGPIVLIGLALKSGKRIAEIGSITTLVGLTVLLSFYALFFPMDAFGVLYATFRNIIAAVGVISISMIMLVLALFNLSKASVRPMYLSSRAHCKTPTSWFAALILGVAALSALSTQPRWGSDLTYYRNDPFFESLWKSGTGYIVVAGLDLVQLRSGRPVLVSLAFNQGLYYPETWSGMLEIYKSVYEVGPEELSQIRGGALFARIFRDQWEKRSYSNWKDLAVRYNFSDVVTMKRGLFLDVPLVAEKGELLHYSLSGGPRARLLAPSSRGEHNVTRAFDRNYARSSYWETKVFPATIEIAYFNANNITGYSLTASDQPAYMPKSWILEGRSAGGAWQLLDQQAGRQFSANRSELFEIPPRSVDTLRFTFTNGHSEILRFTEVQIHGDCRNPDMSFASCRTRSSLP
jgi:hypothetical protein